MLSSALRCPHCGASNPREQRVCLKCSRSLSETSAFEVATSDTATAGSANASTVHDAAAYREAVNSGSANSGAASTTHPAGFVPPGATSSQNVPSAGTTSPLPSTALPMMLGAQPIEDGAPYKSSGKVPGATVGKMLATTILASLVVGVLWHFVGRFYDLLIIFPLLAGAIVGGAVMLVAKNGLSRSTKLAVVCGLLIGPLTYGTKLACNAYSTRSGMVQELTESFTPQGASATQQVQVRQQVEALMTPWETFRIYMIIMEKSGVTITNSHSSSSSSGISLSGKGYWILLGVETLAVGLCAMVLLTSAASEPFCESCQKWHGSSVIMQANPNQNLAIAEAVRTRNWSQLVTTDPGSWNNKAVTTVTMSRCEGCNNATLKTTSTGKFPDDLKNIQLSRPNAETLVGALQHAAENITLPPVMKPGS